MSGHALTAQIIELQSVLSSLDDPAFLREVDRAAEVLVAAATARLPILTCGNGGSAADAQHIATEIVGRFRRKHTPVPAVSLVSDAAVLTAWSNDEGYETVFSRQVEALGREGGGRLGAVHQRKFRQRRCGVSRRSRRRHDHHRDDRPGWWPSF